MLTRRDFVRSTTATLAAAATVPAAAAPARSAELLLQRTIKPVVIADYSGFEFTNSGKENAVARAFRLITEGKDVLDALIAGVNIPELDPLDTGIGFGALPNADGVIELDASCMHGPLRRAGAVSSGFGRHSTITLPTVCTAVASVRARMVLRTSARLSRSWLAARTLISSCAVSARSTSAMTASVTPVLPTLTTGSMA